MEQSNKEIGLKSLTRRAPSVLGIKVMKESFILFKQTALSWKAKQRP
jgi:hypothetical protein